MSSNSTRLGDGHYDLLYLDMGHTVEVRIPYFVRIGTKFLEVYEGAAGTIEGELAHMSERAKITGLPQIAGFNDRVVVLDRTTSSKAALEFYQRGFSSAHDAVQAFFEKSPALPARRHNPSRPAPKGAH